MDGLNLFFQLTKVDAENRLVYGVAASESLDNSKERFHYDSSKPHFEKWSGDIAKATDGKSLGNVREMHQPRAVGKLTDIDFDDENKTIAICTKCVDDDTWRKIDEGVLTGFSIGGKYERKWSDPSAPMTKWYTAVPTEISYVDNPCNRDSMFQMIKADGIVEERRFADSVLLPEGEAETVEKAAEGDIAGDTAETTTEEAVEKAAEGEAAAETTETTESTEYTGPSQVWLAKDGTVHGKKEDALRKDASIEADAALAEKLAPALLHVAEIDAKLGKSDEAETTEQTSAIDTAIAGLGELLKAATPEDMARATAAIAELTKAAKTEEEAQAEDAATGKEREDDDPAEARAQAEDEAKKAAAAAECKKDDELEMAAKAAETGDLAKMASDLEKANAANDVLQKAFDTVVGKLADISERLVKVEQTPLPAATAGAGAVHLPAGVHAVDKIADGGGTVQKADLTAEDLTAALAKMDPEARTHLLTKAALRSPMRVPGLAIRP